MKKVLLITNYFHFISEKESNRYRILCEMLSKEDVELELITSKFYQRTKQFRRDLDELKKTVPYKVTFIDEIGYSKNISFKRLLTSKIFARNVLRYIKSIAKPDVIYQVVPTLDVAYDISKFANKNNIKLIIDIQDLWPEAYKMAINIPIFSNLLFYPIKRKANAIYSRADVICAVSKTYVERALSVNKKCTKGFPVFIGINLSFFDECKKQNHFEKRNQLTIGYCGSLEKSYDIKMVIDALAMIKDAPHFLVIGDGSLRHEFEDYSKKKKVSATFTGYVSYPKMVGLLCACDIVVNPILRESVATIINKHGDYAASGLPVLNTQNSDEYRGLVEKYNMGMNSPSGDVVSLSRNIGILCEDKELREQMGRNSRRCAEELFDRDFTYKQLVSSIMDN